MRKGDDRFGKRFWIGLIPFIILLFSITLGYADWTPVSPPDVSQNWGLFRVYFTSSENGWAVGTDYSNKRGVLIQYRDGSWTSVTLPEVSSDWELQDVHFTSVNGGWAVGVDHSNQNGILLHYSNGFWTVVTSPNVSLNWGLYGVHFTSFNEGWAVGVDYSNQRGVLLHYKSSSWTSVIPPNLSLNWGLVGIHLTSSKEGWVVGIDDTTKRGALLQYHKNPNEKVSTWTVIPPPDMDSDWELNDVHLISPVEGWASGIDYTNKRGALLHHYNSIWAAIIPPDVSSDWELQGVYFTSANEGWAVGVDNLNKIGVLLQYQKGSLTVVTPPGVSSDWGLNGVRFTSSNAGWAVGVDRTNQRGVLLSYASSASETISTPTTPDGPTNGTSGTDYTYSTEDASSSQGHSIQYFFNWGDGTNSGWLPVGTLSVSKNWLTSGTYTVKTQARCATHTSVVSKWSSGLLVNISNPPAPINLLSPANNTHYEACSLYSLPTFGWNAGEPFSSYEIQFSKTQSFSSISVKVKASSTTAPIQSNTWKKVLLIPGTTGGPVYWRVVGTRANKTKATSEINSMIIDPARAVGSPNISDTSKSLLPSLSWENNCNTKSKVWFGINGNFTQKTALSFNIKNPYDNGGVFEKSLKSGQWTSVRRLVKNVGGSTIYWYVESWDGANRKEKTAVMSFTLTE
jgi:hypothetical protein